ncbi:MAG: hypothetical protein WBA74_02755 [Cyclobacteriaceae bacterium]
MSTANLVTPYTIPQTGHNIDTPTIATSAAKEAVAPVVHPFSVASQAENTVPATPERFAKVFRKLPRNFVICLKPCGGLEGNFDN